MRSGFHVMDSDLHVIENGEVYEKYLNERYRDKKTPLPGLESDQFPALGGPGTDDPAVGTVRCSGQSPGISR